MSAALAFPRSLHDVTPAWLTSALSATFPGVSVDSAEPVKVINGMATKVCYSMEYASPAGDSTLPRTLWLKTGFESHSDRSRLLYAAEVSFFRDVAPLLTTTLPRSYFQEIDAETGNGLILMEDLGPRNVVFGDPLRPVSPDTARMLVDELARFHALPTTNPEVRELPWLTPGGAIHAVDVVDEYLAFWPEASRAPRFRFVTPELDDPARVLAGLRRMEDIDKASARWLVHGDPHQGNVFYNASGDAGFLDWQTVMLNHWAFDLSYFLIMSLTVADRRRHERDLVSHYVDRLQAHSGERQDLDEAWLRYRQHAMWAFLTVLCPVARQAEEICTANAERTCAALADLDTFGALGV